MRPRFRLRNDVRKSSDTNGLDLQQASYCYHRKGHQEAAVRQSRPSTHHSTTPFLSSITYLCTAYVHSHRTCNVSSVPLVLYLHPMQNVCTLRRSRFFSVHITHLLRRKIIYSCLIVTQCQDPEVKIIFQKILVLLLLGNRRPISQG